MFLISTSTGIGAGVTAGNAAENPGDDHAKRSDLFINKGKGGEHALIVTKY